jgi:hypothetical protein
MKMSFPIKYGVGTRQRRVHPKTNFFVGAEYIPPELHANQLKSIVVSALGS